MHLPKNAALSGGWKAKSPILLQAGWEDRDQGSDSGLRRTNPHEYRALPFPYRCFPTAVQISITR